MLLKIKLTQVLLFSVLLLQGVWQVALGQDSVQNPEGDFQPSASEDFWPKTLSGGSYYESWTYQFFLDNDVEITMTFSLANMGLRSAVSGVKVSVIGFDNNTYQILREYPVDLLVQDRENWVLRMNPERDIWIEGDLSGVHAVYFKTSKDDIDYDITLRMSDIQPGVKLGDGRFSVNNREVGFITHIPYANVEGEVSINNQSRHVRGTAYMDHTFQDRITSRLLSDGYKYIQHNSPYNWRVGNFLMSDDENGESVIGYEIEKRVSGMAYHQPLRVDRLDRKDLFNYKMAERVNIVFTDSTTRTIVRTRDRERFALFQELGGLARWTARRVLGGEVVEFRGEARFEGESAGSTVHYNYFIVD